MPHTVTMDGAGRARANPAPFAVGIEVAGSFQRRQCRRLSERPGADRGPALAWRSPGKGLAARAVIQSDAVDHFGGLLAVLGDVDQRQRIGFQRAERFDDFRRLQTRLNRIFEVLVGIDLLGVVARRGTPSA